ncbi:hypothetical protein Rhal01_02071 [Rubritalea halochordaticola]|uniref:Thioredoxin domain-containing protein n=1 Tax=Rubritalea halochordaticola TaxID=714537 RepID=A0ABP9V1N6_9BACT
MKFKQLLTSALAATLTIGGALAGGEGWSDDFAASKKQAAEQKKDLLIDFTGSDWCGWCIRLSKEVFKHDAFNEGVKDSFVLVELDYPRDKSKLSEETQEQNAKLQQQYGITGFPTILLCDAEGKPYAKTGYKPGGPEKYVTHLDELRAKRTARDEAFAKAAEATGPEQAKLYLAALQSLGLSDKVIGSTYGDIIEKIKAADPEDSTGFIKKQEEAARQEELNAKLRGMKKDEVITFLDKSLKEDWPVEGKQHIMGVKASYLLQDKKVDECLKLLDEAVSLSPDSETATKLKRFHGMVEKNKEKILSQ